MTARPSADGNAASVEEIQQGWHDLTSRLRQVEAEKDALEQETKVLRSLLERVIDHRQRSHNELVLLLTGLVSKLPINDVGGIVAKLVEHNANVNQSLAALIKRTAEADLNQPPLLQALDHAKHDLLMALKPVIEDLIRLDPPLEPELLQQMTKQPELCFSPPVVRATRCFIKGQVARERIIKEFGEAALIFFDDLTTDPKLNPNPKREEIVLAFKPEFEQLLQQNSQLLPDKGEKLLALYQRVQRSKGATDQARAQKSAFYRMSFILELLHFYEHQNTESPEVLFAQRLPALIEQLVLTGTPDGLDERMMVLAESLLGHVMNLEHRLMIINNLGKSSAAGKSLKYILRLRPEKAIELDNAVAEFVRHLVPDPRKLPSAKSLAPILRLLPPARQRLMARGITHSERLRKEEAEALGLALGAELGLTGLLDELKAVQAISPEMERQMAWAKIHDLIARRSSTGAIAEAIRSRLNAKYNTEEIRQSWLTLIEADPMSLIKICCELPFLANGKTDAIARTVLETYVSRLTHEKYASVYHKIANSLRNLFAVRPDSPTLVNFLALVRWVSPEAANRLCVDIGMPVPAA